jgi:hypothetical protein
MIVNPPVKTMVSKVNASSCFTIYCCARISGPDHSIERREQRLYECGLNANPWPLSKNFNFSRFTRKSYKRLTSFWNSSIN